MGIFFRKENKLFAILDFFSLEIFENLKIRDSRFLALLILRHFI